MKPKRKKCLGINVEKKGNVENRGENNNVQRYIK